MTSVILATSGKPAKRNPDAIVIDLKARVIYYKGGFYKTAQQGHGYTFRTLVFILVRYGKYFDKRELMDEVFCDEDGGPLNAGHFISVIRVQKKALFKAIGVEVKLIRQNYYQVLAA